MNQSRLKGTHNRRNFIMNNIQTVKLNNGIEMPLEGFGVF